MPAGGQWNQDAFDPDTGVRYIAKVLSARVITAGEFDERRNATLSRQLGPDTKVFYYELLNMEATPPVTRATFMNRDDNAVSKWKRWLRAHKSLEVSIKLSPDGTTNLEGMYFIVEEKEINVGKYGKANTIEPVGIPAPEEVQALEKTMGEMVTMGSNGNQPNLPDEGSLLALADGLTPEELVIQLDALGYSGYSDMVKGLTDSGKLVIQNGKLSAPK